MNKLDMAIKALDAQPEASWSRAKTFTIKYTFDYVKAPGPWHDITKYPSHYGFLEVTIKSPAGVSGAIKNYEDMKAQVQKNPDIKNVKFDKAQEQKFYDFVRSYK